jgi:hypothetical protein
MIIPEAAMARVFSCKHMLQLPVHVLCLLNHLLSIIEVVLVRLGGTKLLFVLCNKQK